MRERGGKSPEARQRPRQARPDAPASGGGVPAEHELLPGGDAVRERLQRHNVPVQPQPH